MTDAMIVEAAAFLAAIIAIIVPIFRVLVGHVREMGNYTAELARLVERIEGIEKHFTESLKTLEDRVSEHGREINLLNKAYENHEVRIEEMEKDNEAN